MLQPHHIDPILRAALAEDIPYLDLTTDYTIPADMTSEAKWVAKADGVLCGVDIALRVFSLLDAPAGQEVTYRTFKHDGDRVCKGDILATLSGNTRCLLKGERTALNLLQHLSGIATAAARLVKLVEGTAAAIADTRKTLPGLRALQKYAVTCGGGVNHRFSLSDGVLLKDNHIDAMGGIAAAVAAVRPKLGHMVKLEVETRTLDEVAEALAAGADIIMLDNMDCAAMKKAVEMRKGNVLYEASGNISAETIRAIAETGVDIISVGALTHSVTALDISMTIGARATPLVSLTSPVR